MDYKTDNTPQQSTLFSNEQLWSKIAVALSIAVPVLVVTVFNIAPPAIETDFNWKILPKFHAILNGIVTILLLLSFYFIKNKNK